MSLFAQGDVNNDGHTGMGDLSFLIQWLKSPDATDGHAYVDLDLPSGTLWSKYNLGARMEYKPGGFYAWGETSTKSSYTWQGYAYAGDTDSTFTRYTEVSQSLSFLDDAACVAWGGLWQIPTLAQWQELKDYCTWSWALVNGVYGYRVSRGTGTIFLPAVGYKEGDTYYNNNVDVFYWARELYAADTDVAYGFYMNEKKFYWAYRHRFTGHSIRPVCTPSSSLSRYDVNGDGVVDANDVLALRDRILAQ